MTSLRSLSAAFLALAAFLAILSGTAGAGPIETNIFAVGGVDIDVTSTDAAAAKNQALMDVQVKAFHQLVTRLGSPEIDKELQKWKPEEIAPYLKSLSIEKETSAPGRYIGTFTVRFLPAKIQKLMRDFGVEVPTTQGAPILIVPVWRQPPESKLWEDNPWRKAWLDLKAEQGLLPLIVPLGDVDDSEIIAAEDVLNGDPIKLEALRKRYDAPDLLVAMAEPAEAGGIHVVMTGNTQLGQVTFDKVYTAEDGTVEGASKAAVERIQSILVAKYKEDAAAAAAAATAASNEPRSLSVSIPFSSPTEWNGIRSRILATPNVLGVDVASLSIDGAQVKLTYRNSTELLQENMQRAGLQLVQMGAGWAIQRL